MSELPNKNKHVLNNSIYTKYTIGNIHITNPHSIVVMGLHVLENEKKVSTFRQNDISSFFQKESGRVD